MRKAAVIILALALSGCANQQRSTNQQRSSDANVEYHRAYAACRAVATQQPNMTWAEFIRCANGAEREGWRVAHGTADTDILELYLALREEAANRQDRGQITEAQFDVANAEARTRMVDLLSQRATGRARAADRSSDALIGAGLQLMRQQPAPTATPTAVDCAVTPGSLGRNVACW